MATNYVIERARVAAGCPRCQQARAQFRAQYPDLTPSDVPDHGNNWCAEQSVETFGPNTYNHPRGYVQIRAR